MNGILDEIWDRVVGGLDWLKQVVVGEFDDDRDLSSVIADMLVSFLPGVVIVTSARDLTAVIIRLAKHPEKRNDMQEWMLLVACVLPLVLPILAAAVGAAGAGVGAIVGGIAGSEAGAVLRAVCLLLIKHTTKLAEIVSFLRKFVSGNVMRVLHDVKFAQYGDAITKYVAQFIEGLLRIVRRVKAELQRVNAFGAMGDAIQRLQVLERNFYAVQMTALKSVPESLVELDARLQKILSEAVEPERALAYPGVPAPKVKPVRMEGERVPAMPGNPLGMPAGTSPPPPPRPPVEPRPNLHPEKPPANLRKPREPTANNPDIDHSKTRKNPDGSTTYYDKQGRPVTYKNGFPDFRPYAEADVKVPGLKGKIPPDDDLANAVAGYDGTPSGYTWHHVEGGEAMQLVPRDIHETFPHTGGASVLRNAAKPDGGG